MLIALAHRGVVIPADDAPTPTATAQPNPATTNATLVREVLPVAMSRRPGLLRLSIDGAGRRRRAD
jgi:hypothetical protein